MGGRVGHVGDGLAAGDYLRNPCGGVCKYVHGHVREIKESFYIKKAGKDVIVDETKFAINKSAGRLLSDTWSLVVQRLPGLDNFLDPHADDINK